jgi:addiction module HigA family antidote
MASKKIDPIHPGEILLEEFLKPMGLSQNRLARDIGVSPRRINEIVLGKRALTADTALRLARYFKMSPKFWLGLQMDFELDVEMDRLGSRLNQEVGQYRKAG